MSSTTFSILTLILCFCVFCLGAQLANLFADTEKSSNKEQKSTSATKQMKKEDTKDGPLNSFKKFWEKVKKAIKKVLPPWKMSSATGEKKISVARKTIPAYRKIYYITTANGTLHSIDVSHLPMSTANEILQLLTQYNKQVKNSKKVV